MKKILFFAFIALCLNACFSDNKTQVVTIDNKFSMTLPTFLTKTNQLNDDASLQYKNELREFYVVVLVDTKEEFHKSLEENELTDSYSYDLTGFSSLLLDYGFKSQLKIAEESALVDTLINGMSAQCMSITGRQGDVDVYANLGFVKGENSYYQVIVWTLANRKERYQKRMEQVLYSLKEL